MRVAPRKITAPTGSFVMVPRGVDHFFEEAAEGRIPLQAEPTDPAVLEKLTAFTAKYGYEFADLPSES